MLRRAFHAMGTEVELLLDAEPSAESELAFAHGRARVRAAGSAAVPLPPRLRALGAQPLRRPGRRPRSRRRHAPRRRGPGADRRPVRPDRPRRPRARRATTARSTRFVPDGHAQPAKACRGGRCGSRAAGSSSSPASGSTSAASRRATPSTGRWHGCRRAGPCLVNAGGDLAGRGRLWPVGVETADGELTLGLENGALATSGRDRRRWQRDGHERHHLIDPATGTSAEGEFLRVTVLAPTAVDAEVLAKAAFLGAPVGNAGRVRHHRRPHAADGGHRMKTDPTFWLLARATGLTAYVLLTTSVLAGLTVKSRPLGARVKAAVVTDLHRFLSLLGLGAIAAPRPGADARLDRANAVRGARSCRASAPTGRWRPGSAYSPPS